MPDPNVVAVILTANRPGLRRKCTRCGAEGGIETFRKRRDANTLDPHCRACQCRARRKAGFKPHSVDPAIHRAYKARNPEKIRAQHAVENEIRRGRMHRKPCEECGELKSEAHHADYSKPLEVKWLCHPCHRKEHRKYGD